MLTALCDKVLYYPVHLSADFLATSLRDLPTLFFFFPEGVGRLKAPKCELISYFRE